MSDPWAEKRERIEDTLESIHFGYNQGEGASVYPAIDKIRKEVRGVLTDADALLVVVRDVIAKCEDPQYRTRMTQQQQIEFLEMLRNSVLATLPEHLR